MDYECMSISLSDFIEKLGVYFNVNQLKNLNQLEALKMMSESHLEAESDINPDIFHYPEVDGSEYIAIYNKARNESEVFLVSSSEYEHRYSKMIADLERAGRLNGATRYLLEQSFQWDVEQSYYEILTDYHLAIFIPKAESYSEGVAVWCHYHFGDGFDADKKNGFVCCNGEVSIFAHYSEAKAYCSEQLNRQYSLSAGELCRPTYTITYPL